MFVVVGDRGRDQVNLLTLRYAKYCIVMTLMSAAGCPPASHVVQSHCQSSPLCSLVLQKRSRLQQVCDDEYFTHQALYFCVYLYIQCYYRTFVEYVLATAKSAWDICKRRSKLGHSTWIRTTLLSSLLLPLTSATVTTMRPTRSWETPLACVYYRLVIIFAICRWTESLFYYILQIPHCLFNFLCQPGLWSSNSQSLSKNYWNGWRRGYRGDPLKDNELSETALCYDYGVCVGIHICLFILLLSG